MRVRKQAGGLPVEQINPLAPSFADYELGPIFHNGAADFVYRKAVTDPLQVITGAGRPTWGQFNIFEPGMVRGVLAVPAASVEGAGVLAGGFDQQALTDANIESAGETAKG